MESNSTFGQWLKQSRKACELTQHELARRVGCAATTLRLLEADKRRPSKQLAQRLAVILHIPDEHRSDFLQRARTRVMMTNLAPPPQSALSLSNRSRPMSLLRITQEHAECITLLSDPACRLLTIVGPSGAGKTILAQAIAADAKCMFRHGVAFVSLTHLNDVAALPTTILTQLGLPEYDNNSAESRLFDYLHNKDILIILDAFERFVSKATFLAQLLQLTAATKLLVTSHERLALQAEWLYELSVDD